LKSLATEWFIVLILAAMFQGNRPWQEKPYTEWAQRDLDNIFNHSPWVRQVEITVGKGSPMDAPDPNSAIGREYQTGGARDPNVPKVGRNDGAFQSPNVETLTFDIRWASSLIWRQFKVRQAQLAGVQDKNAEAALNQSPANYKISLSGGPPTEYSGLTEAMLRQSAYLETEKTKQKIPVGSVWISPAWIDFYFPRQIHGTPIISEQETKVSFHCKLKVSSIQAEFDLKKMVRQGKPDL